MSVKDSEYKMTTTYHTQMRQQSKYRLELDVADSPRPVINKAELQHNDKISEENKR